MACAVAGASNLWQPSLLASKPSGEQAFLQTGLGKIGING
jgi:hypothetical protein